MKALLDSEQIKKILPHRYPFLLVDKIIEMTDKTIVGIKNVTVNEHFFQGHFPEKSVMPGVLIVEALSQAGAVLLLSLPKFAGKLAYLAGIKNFKFKRQVVPGDTLTLNVELTYMRLHLGTASVSAWVGDELVTSGEVQFSIPG